MEIEEESQSLEVLRVVLQHGLPHDAEAGRRVLLPLDVALDDGLHPLPQQLVDRRDVVNQIGHIPAPLWKTQFVTTTQYPAV